MTRLEGRVCLVTGGTRGIGEAIARRFAREGARVAVTSGHSLDAAREVAESLGGGAIGLDADVRSTAEVAAAVEETRRLLGPIDVLVNNAGVLVLRPFEDIPEEEWAEVFDVNLNGMVRACRAVLPAMRERRRGKVVNISSVGGQTGGTFAVHYAVAKAAVIGLTRSLARVYAGHGVQVNAIAPGLIRTAMSEPILARVGDAAATAGIPAGRIGAPDDVAGAAVFLASSDSDYMTGQTLNVNGGQYLG